MSERDAFGNQITPADATAAFEAAPAALPSPATTGARPRGGAPGRLAAPLPAAGGTGAAFRVARRLVSLALSLAIVAGIGFAVLAGPVSRSVDAVRSLSTELRVPGAPVDAAPSRPPVGLGAGSLLRRADFGAAIASLRGSGLGRLRTLRLAPERIDAQLITADGRLRSVQVVPGGKRSNLSTSAPGFPTTATMSLGAINRGAPQRLARSAARRAGRPVSAVDYLVLVDIVGTASWVVYLKDGRSYLADAAGRIQRRTS